MDIQVVPTCRPDYSSYGLRKAIESNELLLDKVMASLENINKRLDRLEQANEQSNQFRTDY